MTGAPSRPWTVIVPVKSSVRAKSRLLLEPAVRRELARAMAADTVTAVVRAEPVGRTIVVVEHLDDAARLVGLPGVRVVHTVTNELNAAIMDGLAGAGPGPGPGTTGPVAVVPADLPSLTASELAQALAMANPRARAVVPDRPGSGTTLLAARSAALLRPRYGRGSLRRHVADGAVPLPVPAASGLRRDVDLVDDLRWVTGAATRSVLAAFDASAWRPTG